MALREALEQCWPPFVLVAGLLLIGLVAGGDGLFAAAADRLERLPGPPLALFAACCAVVTVTTALLNLDTAAVFLTPVLVEVARRRGCGLEPFLYGSLLMVNASSLYLPGSNLTNLLVLATRRGSGGAFFVQMLPAALTATVVTAAGIALLQRRALTSAERPSGESLRVPHVGIGLLATAAAAALMVLLRNAALPVLAIGIGAAGLRLAQGRLTRPQLLDRLGAPVLVALFVLAVGLGTLARTTGFPGHALATLNAPASAAVAALGSVLVNNLPAAVLLSAAHPLHPIALLLGLNVGPNLAVTGSLSALLWWRSARGAGARPSMLAFSKNGVILAPIAIAAALAVSSALRA